MAILITGGTGFIGSALSRALLKNGEHVHVLGYPQQDINVSPHPNLSVHYGDTRSEQDVSSAMQGCAAVYHLAACACPWLPRNDDFFDVNVRGTDTVLACAKRLGVKRTVVTSTNLTIGPSSNGIITEESVRTTDFYNTYERSKAAADLVGYRYALDGLPVVTVHPTRVFGPGPLSEANSVTKMILWYIQGSWRLIPGTGNAVGNYVYLDDLIDGYLRAMASGRTGEHYILGGENISYNDLFALVTALSGIPRRMLRLPPWVALPFARIQEIVAELTGIRPLVTPGWTRVFLDDWTTCCDKARTELGYHITPIRTAVARLLDWFERTGLAPASSTREHMHQHAR